MSHPPRRACRIAVVLIAMLGPVPQSLKAQEPGAAIKWWHGAAAVGAFAILTTLDNPLQDFVRDNRSETSNDVARVAKRMGQPEAFAGVGLGVLATGLISGNQRIRDAGVRISSSLALAGALVTVSKFAAGRARPSGTGHDADNFRPFSGQTSAPSGHTTMAFALAASVSDEIRNSWVTFGLYTAAAATAWSRVNDNAHWTSDVISGAALGIVSAKFVNGRLRLFGLRSPLVGATTRGVSVSWRGSF